MDDKENLDGHEEVKDEVVDGQEPVEQGSQEEKVDERPEKNWKAEIDRKNREIERLRQEQEDLKRTSVQRRDQNDMSTWADHELLAIKNSADPQAVPFRAQAEDILLERKVQRIREKERVQEKRAMSDVELRTRYPEASDPSSDFSYRMEQVMHDLELQKSPAGRLAAARIVAAEMGQKVSKTDALRRKNEESRVREVKGQMVDGDRPRSAEAKNDPKKVEEIEKGLLQGKDSAVGDALSMKGIRDRFNKVWDQR